MDTAYFQNIVTFLGLTDGLREFIKIDNERALEVGYLNRVMGTCKVRKFQKDPWR